MKFGEWLGESNGKTMLFEILKEDISKEQARAAVTTYCILFDINVDTAKWDTLMAEIWKYYNGWFETFDEMDGFMCGLLI